MVEQSMPTGTHVRQHWGLVISWLAFAVPFASATSLMGPSPGWLDSPELVAAAFSLGISHPPGHPAYSLLGHWFAMVPLGSIAFRLTLCSAFCFGATVWLAYRAALHIQASILGQDVLRLRYRCLTCACVWIGGFSFTAMFQAVRPEVYMFHAALAMGAIERLLAAWRGILAQSEGMDDSDAEPIWGLPQNPQHAWMASSLCVGVGLANHHYLMILLLPGWLVMAVWIWRRSTQRAFLAVANVVLVVVGLSTYAYLPVRSAQLPEVHWGGAHSLKGFFWQVSAKAWQRSLQPQSAQSLPQRAMMLFSIYVEQLGFWMIFGLLGLYLLLRQSFWVGLSIALWGAGIFAGRWVMIVDRLNADLHGYLAVSMWLIGICVSFLVVFCWYRLSLWSVGFSHRSSRYLLGQSGHGGLVLCLLLHFLHLISAWLIPEETSFSLSQCDKRKQLGPLLWSEFMEDPLPYQTLLLTSYYQNGFLRWYRKVVERQRPDITLIQRNLLAHPVIAAQEAARNPKLARLLGLFVKDRKGFFRELKTLTAQRTVCFEWYQDLPADLARELLPIGMFFCWYPQRVPSKQVQDDDRIREQQSHFWNEVYAALGNQWKFDRETRNLLVWTHYQHALFYKQTGRWRAGLAEVRYGLQLSAQSKELLLLLKEFRQKLASTGP